MSTKNNISVTTTVNDISPLFNITDLANYLGVGRNRAYELLKKQIIKGFRIGSTWKVSKAAVDQYISKNSGLWFKKEISIIKTHQMDNWPLGNVVTPF